MKNWLDQTREQLQKGEALISSSVNALFRGWQNPSERWQAAIRENQATENLADILRARSL